MVGHKYGVLRWSKAGSNFFNSLSSVIFIHCVATHYLLTPVIFLFPEKTIEGTAAGITSVLAACFVLLPLLAATGYIFTMVSLALSMYIIEIFSTCVILISEFTYILQHWFSLIVAVTTSGLLEAYTAQLDNAFIPLIFYSMLCL